MTFDQWWQSLTAKERYVIGINNAKFVWEQAIAEAEKQKPMACANCDELSKALALAIWDRQDVERLLFKLTGIKWIPKENTSQAKCEWVGLTDEEIHNTEGYQEDRALFRFARAIEAKLKEKNT